MSTTKRIMTQQISSPDSSSTAQAKSVVITSGSNHAAVLQSVSVHLSENGVQSCSSSSASSQATNG